ncbi:MAG TPA: NAD(P)-dependent oxidoreductase [Stellaceae bacterium]|nr:NAD(P)-dependent oxidoreductase [Stellaceae bacterium]
MVEVLVEADAVLRAVAVALDPSVPEEHLRAVADWYSFDEPDFAGWLARLQQRLPGLYPAKVAFARDEADMRAKLGSADALVVEGFAVGTEELRHAKKLKIVQKFGGLAHNIDAAACFTAGVKIDVQKRRVNIAVAEQALALMLALAKRVPELAGVVTESALRAAGFDPRPFDRRYTGNSNFARITGLRTLSGATLGIVGMGEIGREIAARAAAFGMSILYYQRNRIARLDEAALKTRYAPLDQLMAQSDYITPALPLNDSTRGIIGKAELAHVKPGAMLVNVARGELVDHDALVEALQSGRLSGFALDVGYQEPATPSEPLLAMRKNVILMPHTAPAERQNNLDDLAEMCLKIWRGLTGASVL